MSLRDKGREILMRSELAASNWKGVEIHTRVEDQK